MLHSHNFIAFLYYIKYRAQKLFAFYETFKFNYTVARIK